jgi:sortase A
VAKKQSLQDLSADELRWLLLEKRRTTRQERLEHYRRTGRVLAISPEDENPALDQWATQIEDEHGPVKARPRSKRILDGFLLVVELSAVVGFIFILFNGLNLLKELNHEVVNALDQPTLTPTPLIMAVVLPSGHTPPNSPGGTKFNDAEIPDHLRPLLQSLVNVSMPTPSPEQAIRIQIPALHLDAPIVQGDGWEQLKKGVGQHAGSINPGQKGNLVLSAHNDIFGEIFRDLDRLNTGDEIVLYTNQQSYHYIISNRRIVEPTDVSVMSAGNQPIVTLISCYPYMVDNQRIVITANLQNNGS